MRVAGVARGWIFLLLYPTLQLTPATLAQGDYPNAYTTLSLPTPKSYER